MLQDDEGKISEALRALTGARLRGTAIVAALGLFALGGCGLPRDIVGETVTGGAPDLEAPPVAVGDL